MDAATQREQRPLWRRLLPAHPIRRAVLLVALALVVEYLVLPQIGGVERSLHLLNRINIGLAFVGVGLEVASLAAYAQLTRAMLPKGLTSFSRLWRIDLSTLAVSHVLPGGTAGGDGLAYQLLTKEGATGSEAAFALATAGIGSAIVLNVILWLALIVSIPLSGFNPLYATAAGVGVVIVALFAALLLLFTKGRDRAQRALRAISSKLPFLTPERAEEIVGQICERILSIASDRALLVRALCWAAANWLLDAAALWVFLAAFGHFENPDGLLVAYGLAFVLAAIPITPGGLGVVEGILVPSLVGFGATRSVAVLGVLGYRLVNFWLPIPVGAGAYISLGSARRERRRPVATFGAALSEARGAMATNRRVAGYGPLERGRFSALEDLREGGALPLVRPLTRALDQQVARTNDTGPARDGTRKHAPSRERLQP